MEYLLLWLSTVACMAEERYRVEELAAATDVGVDTIRYYQAQGLLAAPVKDGRIAWYGTSHVTRLSEIRELSDQGFSLAQIRALADDDDPLLRSLITGSGDTPTIGRDELARRSNLPAEAVALAIEVGLLSPTVIDGEERFTDDAVDMLASARLLIDAGVDPTVFTELAVRHAEHTEKLVDDAIGIIHDLIESKGLSRSDSAAMIELAIPKITKLVAGHFQQTLVARATARLTDTDEPR